MPRAYGQITVLSRGYNSLIPAATASVRAYVEGTVSPYLLPLYPSADSLEPFVFPVVPGDDGVIAFWADVPDRLDIEATWDWGAERVTLDLEYDPDYLVPYDDRFVNVAGDTMTGDLTLDQGFFEKTTLQRMGIFSWNDRARPYPSAVFRATTTGGQIEFGSGTGETDTFIQRINPGIIAVSDSLWADYLQAGIPPLAQSGVLRLPYAGAISWRDVANLNDLSLYPDNTGTLLFNGTPLLTQTLGDTRYVNTDGDAMTGPLFVQGKPVSISADTGNTLEWRGNGLFSSGVAGGVSSVNGMTGAVNLDPTYVNVTGDTMSGGLTLPTLTVGGTTFASLLARVTMLETQMAGHTHTSGTIDVMGGAAILP